MIALSVVPDSRNGNSRHHRTQQMSHSACLSHVSPLLTEHHVISLGGFGPLKLQLKLGSTCLPACEIPVKAHSHREAWELCKVTIIAVQDGATQTSKYGAVSTQQRHKFT
jgi:hypothetical protein